MKLRFGKPDVGMLCNGMLAGLVAITAPCAFVTAPVAILIGVVAGVLVIDSAMFIENALKIDDPVGASSVHGVCGAWGILSLGLFADGRYGDGWNGVPGKVTGLFYGDGKQFVAECIGILVCVALGRHDDVPHVAGHRRRSSATACPPSPSWRAWTCPRWASRATRPSRCPIDLQKGETTVSVQAKDTSGIDDEDRTAPGRSARARGRVPREAGGRRAVGPRADGVPGAARTWSCW